MMRRILTLSIIFLLLAVGGYVVYRQFMAPTRILVVNALEAQQADFVLNNDSRHISVSCVDADQMTSLDGYDAIIFYARRIFLTDEQMAEVQRVAGRGVPVFTKTLRTSDFVENHNLTDAQIDTLKQYFENDNRQNYRNGLRYLRHIATPRRWGDQQVEPPVEVPKNMFYHRQYGQYFKTADELTAYLRHQGLYHEGRPTVAMISGITFPMEGNREHVDTLITMLTQRGMNVYPLTGMGKMRDRTAAARRRRLSAYGTYRQRHTHTMDASEERRPLHAVPHLGIARRMARRARPDVVRLEERPYRHPRD